MLIPLTSRIRMFIQVDAPVETSVLTGYAAQIALIPDDTTASEPGAGDWKAATWIGAAATLVIEPSGATPYPPGEYMAFVRITSPDERPVLPSGRVRIGLP